MTVSSNLIEPTIYALASENDILLVVTTKDADTMVAEMVIPEIVRITTFILHQELLKPRRCHGDERWVWRSVDSAIDGCTVDRGRSDGG